MNQIFETLLNGEQGIFDFFDQVFLFGSCLYSSTPNDIDILLVYGTADPKQVNFEKSKIEQVLRHKFIDYALDFTTLSKSELQQTGFLMKVSHRKIKG